MMDTNHRRTAVSLRTPFLSPYLEIGLLHEWVHCWSRLRTDVTRVRRVFTRRVWHYCWARSSQVTRGTPTSFSWTTQIHVDSDFHFRTWCTPRSSSFPAGTNWSLVKWEVMLLSCDNVHWHKTLKETPMKCVFYFFLKNQFNKLWFSMHRREGFAQTNVYLFILKSWYCSRTTLSLLLCLWELAYQEESFHICLHVTPEAIADEERGQPSLSLGFDNCFLNLHYQGLLFQNFATASPCFNTWWQATTW